MYQESKRICFSNSTVKDVIQALQCLPEDMLFATSGSTLSFLHVDSDENICSFDDSPLYDCYDDDSDEDSIIDSNNVD